MKNIILTATGLTGKEWIERIEKGEYKISTYAKDLLLSEDFNKNISKKGAEFNVCIVPQIELGLGKYVSTKEIKEYAEKKGWSVPTPEIACLVREAVSDKEMEDMGVWYIAALHEPIKDSDGDPRVLFAYRDDDGRRLGTFWGDPDDQWGTGGAFPFLVPQVLRTLKLSPPQKLWTWLRWWRKLKRY